MYISGGQASQQIVCFSFSVPNMIMEEMFFFFERENVQKLLGEAHIDWGRNKGVIKRTLHQSVWMGSPLTIHKRKDI